MKHPHHISLYYKSKLNVLTKYTLCVFYAAEVTAYETAVHSSWIADELKVCRNSHAAFHTPLGLAGGMVHTALSSFITKGKEPWTLK